MNNIDSLFGALDTDGNTNEVSTNIFGSINGSEVQLVVFSPSQHGTQVVRPYKYTMDDNLLDIFSSVPSSTAAAAELNNANNQSVNTAVMPDPVGIKLNTDVLNTMYSFVLVINTAPPARSRLHFSAQPRTRMILTGYFVDEPFARDALGGGLTPNPNAMLVFTHGEKAILQDSFASASGSTLNITTAEDIIPTNISALTSNGSNLAMCDFRSVAQGSNLNILGGETENIFEFDASPDISKKTAASSFDDVLKSPRHQLSTIADAVSSGHALFEDQVSIQGAASGDTFGGSGVEAFLKNVNDNLSSQGCISPHQGVNPSYAMKLSELDSNYPQMNVDLVDMPFDPMYDITDQTRGNKRTIYSSLIATALSGFATNVGLASVAFRYSSYAKTAMVPHRGGWRFEEHGTRTIVEDVDGRLLKQAVMSFKKLMESFLIPIIVNLGGDFDLMVHYDTISKTAVDLIFCDERDDADGFFVTRNRMGGMLSPAIGSTATAEFNLTQLNRMYRHLGTHAALPDFTETDFASNGGGFDNDLFV